MNHHAIEGHIPFIEEIDEEVMGEGAGGGLIFQHGDDGVGLLATDIDGQLTAIGGISQQNHRSSRHRVQGNPGDSHFNHWFGLLDPLIGVL